MPRERTTALVMRSFLTLLSERPLSKITVKDIVSGSGVSRNTFYYHYNDIDALLTDVLETEIVRTVRDSTNISNWTDALHAVTRFAAENKQAVIHIYNSDHRSQIDRYIFDVCNGIIEKVVCKEAEGMPVSTTDITYIRLFYAQAIVGLFHQWIQSGMQNDPEIPLRRISYLFADSMPHALARAAQGEAL